MNEKDLQVLTYNLFERTGEFIYGIYQFLIRNPVLMKFLRQKVIHACFTYISQLNFNFIFHLVN